MILIERSRQHVKEQAMQPGMALAVELGSLIAQVAAEEVGVDRVSQNSRLPVKSLQLNMFQCLRPHHRKVAEDRHPHRLMAAADLHRRTRGKELSVVVAGEF
jgi:hypothetical protein